MEKHYTPTVILLFSVTFLITVCCLSEDEINSIKQKVDKILKDIKFQLTVNEVMLDLKVNETKNEINSANIIKINISTCVNSIYGLSIDKRNHTLNMYKDIVNVIENMKEKIEKENLKESDYVKMKTELKHINYFKVKPALLKQFQSELKTYADYLKNQMENCLK